eukprot:SAG31_NODE_17183_length_680_cov_0.896730_1_plen_122_part_10
MGARASKGGRGARESKGEEEARRKHIEEYRLLRGVHETVKVHPLGTPSSQSTEDLFQAQRDALKPQYSFEMKVVLLGAEDVGAKTSLCDRFFHNYFNESTMPTIGASFYLKTFTVDGQAVSV